MAINRNSPVPIADQIAADLRRRIADGRIAERLPTIKALAGEYGVAGMTVQAALKALQAEGLIAGVGGRGTFVRAGDTGVGESAELAELRRDLDEIRGRLDALERIVRTGGD